MKGQEYKLGSGRSDKKDGEPKETQGSCKEEVSYKVSPQGPNMTCENVDQIAARRSGLAVGE